MHCERRHSKFTGLSATRGALTMRLGAAVMGKGGRGFVHRDRQRAGGQVPDELFRLSDILHAIFPTAAGKTNNGWPIVKAVEKTVGGEVTLAAVINGSYPADGPRPDNSVQRVVRQPVSVRRLVEVHTIPVTKKEISRLTYLPRRRQRVSYAAVQRRLP